MTLIQKEFYRVFVADILYKLTEAFFIPRELALLYKIAHKVAENAAEVFVTGV